MAFGTETLPEAFTFPFRYTPHPLCRKAALVVQEQLRQMGVREGKMYGVLIVEGGFLAAYSGQLGGSYDHPWFVPPVVDYLDPASHFQREQAAIVALTRRMEAMQDSAERRARQQLVQRLRSEREAAVAEAKRVYAEGKARRAALRAASDGEREALIRESQQQKADIHRARHLHYEAIAEAEAWLTAFNADLRALSEERRQRSEALQQWLFVQFDFLNAHGERRNLTDIFHGEARRLIPSGAGECCAPKLLQAAYRLGLRPRAMAEFWWGPSSPGHYREPGAFFPACHSKCRPILSHMLQGLDVEPDPAEHYKQVLAPVRIVWEDEHLAVVAKPEGWVSIPGKSHQLSLLDAAHRLWPGIKGSVVVHRLDQDTSGLMVVAKSAAIHRALSILFERRAVQKRYVALLETGDRPSLTIGGEAAASASGVLSLPLGPDLENMPRQHVDRERGKEAVTAYEVLGREQREGCAVTRVAFYPKTGRTHQLRVHSAASEGFGAPILGDRLYGHMAARLYLHAEVLAFEHPVTHEPLRFELPAPF